MKKINEEGVVSFFAVIFISILLTLITIAYVSIMTREQRQATDLDLSTRALYAADAGVEDAIDSLRSGKNINKDRCNNLILSSSDDFDIEYTCQIVSSKVKYIESELDPEQTMDIDLGSVPGLASIRLSWHQPSEDERPAFVDNTRPGLGENMIADSWLDNNYPTIMRVNFISNLTTPVVTRGSIINNTTFAYPSTRSSNPGFDKKLNGPTSCSELEEGSTQYACTITLPVIGAASNRSYFLRLTALQVPTHFKLEMLDANGNPLDFQNNVYRIDSTGRSGDVYRRVVTIVKVGGADGVSNLLGHNALTSDDGVCKNFSFNEQSMTASSEDGCD